MPHLLILGTRGVPANHGGFETFAERLALFLCSQPDWSVTVYCQGSATGEIFEDDWHGVRRVHIPIPEKSRFGTIVFDFRATRHARKQPGSILTLGYNTGFLCLWLWACRRKHHVNMDGIEWHRAKYHRLIRLWFHVNEHLAAMFATGMIADHPDIAAHLSRKIFKRRARRTTTIVYGADEITTAPLTHLLPLGLEAGKFLTLIARPEPENSILEIVRAFATLKADAKLVVLGTYDPANRYHAQVLAAKSNRIIFPGAIYDKDVVAALRFHSIGYLHGHQVGGTNPSLVEALGAGNAIIAHENDFNRWVAADAALYFSNGETCAAQIESLINDEALRTQLSAAARRRWSEQFRWESVLAAYQALLGAEPARATIRRRWWWPWRSAPQPIEAPSLTPSSA